MSYVNSFTEAGSFGPRFRVPGYYRHMAVVTPSERFLSAGIDLLPIAALQLLTIPGARTDVGNIVGLVVALASGLFFLFNNLYLVRMRGQTLGKMILGHHIVHVRYYDAGWWMTRMTWRLALLRFAGHCLDLVSLPLSLVKVLFTSRRASIGDTLANTIVVPYHYFWNYTPSPSDKGGYADREG